MLGLNLLGIYEKAFDPADDWAMRLQKAKSLGFDFMEICIDEQDCRLERLYWDKTKRTEFRNILWEFDLPIQSMCLSGHRRFPFGSSDALLRKKAFDIMDRAIDFAVDMGIRVIQVAGYDVYYEDSTDESRKAFMNGLIYSAHRAAQKQVMLATEIMDTPLINSITKHLVYEKKINSPWFRVYPDIGNLSAWGNDINSELTKGIGSIVSIHLKDTLAVTDTFPGKFKCVPFGTGCVDFSSGFAQLEKLNYTGPFVIEMWHQENERDIEMVAAAKRFIEEHYAARNIIK